MNFNALLAGGIFAAIAGAWAQVKSAFNYISSFVVVRATMDDTTSMVIREHIRTQWRLLPSGLVFYTSRYLTFKDESYSTIVPFKLPAGGAVFVKGWRILFVSDKGGSMSVTYLRGTVDFDRLVSDNVQGYNTNYRNSKDSTNRFHIVRHMGREKSMFSSPKAEVSPQVTGSNSPEGALTGSGWHLDVSIDTPMLYDKSMWLYNKEEDPFKALHFPTAVLDYVSQLNHWLQKGEWYAERMIPWRRGVLLHGPGGTGKTSLAKAIGQVMKIPVHQYYLSTMSDQEFVETWDSMITPCIALLEDFDNVFHGRENVTEHRLLTFDCVLNQISGINSHNGVLLIVTTNHIDKIDPAMGVAMKGDGAHGVSTRPGRIDKVIEVGYLDYEGKKFLANRILRDWPNAATEMVAIDYDVTPAQFQEMCVQKALTLMETTRCLEKS